MPIPLTGAILLPDGTWVRGRALCDAVYDDDPPDFGLYLGIRPLLRCCRDRIHWEHRWVTWPDFLLPVDTADAVDAITATHRALVDGRRVDVACHGGIGRTGTALACLVVLAGLEPAAAITWTRGHYHGRAVETPWQRRWVTRFAHAVAAAPLRTPDLG